MLIAVPWDPRMPNLAKVSTKHWRSMVFEDPYLKCDKICLICPYIRERKTLEGKGFTRTIKDEVNCKTKNIVYMVMYNISKCKVIYIGETHKQLYCIICEHLGWIRTKKTNKTKGNHFNKPGH